MLNLTGFGTAQHQSGRLAVFGPTRQIVPSKFKKNLNLIKRSIYGLVFTRARIGSVINKSPWITARAMGERSGKIHRKVASGCISNYTS